ETHARGDVVLVAREALRLWHQRIGQLRIRRLLEFVTQAQRQAETRPEFPLILNEARIISGGELKTQWAKALLISRVVGSLRYRRRILREIKVGEIRSKTTGIARVTVSKRTENAGQVLTQIVRVNVV